MRPILVATLALALLMTASCTGNKTTPSPTATSTIASSTSGSGVISVPGVVGLNVGAAKHAIKDVGLSWDLTVVTGDYTHAAVVQQHPAPGSGLQPGATVHIVSGPA